MKKNVPIDLGSGSVFKLLIRLALPAVVAQIINMLYNLVDRIYVGRIAGVGTDALAGLGVCFPIILTVSAFSVLVGMGGAPLAAIKMGEKDDAGAEKILNNGVVLLAILGVVLTTIILLFSERLLKAFGAPSSSLAMGDSYLKIYASGTIFVMFAMGLNYYVSAQGFALTSMLTVAIGALLNIALDPLFIFTFKMGVKGAALATVISQAVSCVWIIGFFLSKRSKIKIRPKLFALRKKTVLSMLALGVSPFIMQITESAVQIVFNVQINRYTGGSEVYVAALTIMMSVMQMITLPLNGIGTGAQPLISFNYGAGNTDRIRKTIKYLVIISLCVCGLIWILCLCCPRIFAGIFSASGEVAAVVVKYMPVFMMGTIMFFAQFSLQNAFLALGQAKISMALALLRKVILLIPLTFLLPLSMKEAGIFYAEGIADLSAGIVTAAAFLFTYKGILRRREAELASSLRSVSPTGNRFESEFFAPPPSPDDSACLKVCDADVWDGRDELSISDATAETPPDSPDCEGDGYSSESPRPPAGRDAVKTRRKRNNSPKSRNKK